MCIVILYLKKNLKVILAERKLQGQKYLFTVVGLSCYTSLKKIQGLLKVCLEHLIFSVSSTENSRKI